MPLFSRKHHGFSFKREANGGVDIKDDRTARRDFKFTSNLFTGTSVMYQTDGDHKPAHTPTPSPPTPLTWPPPTRQGTGSSIFDAYNAPPTPGPYHDLEPSFGLTELFRRIWTLVGVWFSYTPPPLPIPSLTPLPPIATPAGERANLSQSCPGGTYYVN